VFCLFESRGGGEGEVCFEGFKSLGGGEGVVCFGCLSHLEDCLSHLEDHPKTKCLNPMFKSLGRPPQNPSVV
jgi:hypothetical protein